MVSSGAIAEGVQRLGWPARPKELHALQAAAAVGQMGLAQMYETQLRQHGVGSAQILLTHADLADRERYLNARSTLLTLLAHQVVPVINENDSVVNDERGALQHAPSWIPRLLPAGVHYEGRIHEQPASALPRERLALVIGHDGYLDRAREAKAGRNERLLRLAPGLISAGLAVPAADALPLYIRDKVARTTAERAAAPSALVTPA